jgi:hypothetical protein
VPRFVIERDVANVGDLSNAELEAISRKSLDVLKEMGPAIQWLHSYVIDDKIYCVYMAPDENTLREHAKRAGIPANRVSAVRHMLDPTNYQ